MKDFSKLRTELNEHVDVSHNSMPPNILILRRKTVRQFPNHVMVALYYNERLNQYFSIPYGGDADDSVITPVSLKEAQELMEDDEYLSHSTSRAGKAAQKSSWMANFEKHVVKTNPAHSGKINWNDAHFHHSQGTAPEVAAKKYTDSNPTPFESHFHRESEELNEGAADDKRQEQQKTLWAKRQKRWGDWKDKQAKIQADMKTAGSKRDYDDHYMEETEQIDELSKDTMLRYVRSATKNKDFLTAKAEMARGMMKNPKHGDELDKKSHKRTSGILRATEKLEEAEQLNEDIMDRLHYIRTSKIARNIDHDNGTKTMNVQPETAHAVLRYHSQLTGNAQKDFEKDVRGSRHTFSGAAYEATTGKKAGKVNPAHGNINEATNANPIDTLRKIRDTHSMTHVSHDDGTKTHVDHVTAHMLLTVHDALNPTNQEKFGTAMKKSKPMFHKMVDLGWKQVK